MRRLILALLLLLSVAPLVNADESETPQVDVLPQGLYPALIEARQQGDGYAVLPDVDGYSGRNAAHNLTMTFTPRGVRLQMADTAVSVRLGAYGYAGALHHVGAGAISAVNNRVEYDHGALTEWYVNGPLGVQQGFTMETAPQGADANPLHFVLETDLSVRLSDDGAAFEFLNADDQIALRYSGLYVYDARHEQLSAHLALIDGAATIVVDDRGAVYPVTVDPFFTGSQLVPSDSAAGNELGYSVFINNSTAIVGVPGDNDRGANSGSVYIFRFSNLTRSWTKTVKLTAPDAAPGDRFGAFVSGDPETILVGAPGHNNGQGALYFFTGLPDSAYRYHFTLTAPDGAPGHQFGSSGQYTTTYAFGNISYMAVGAPGNGSGAVYVWTRDNNVAVPTWSYMTSITPADGIAEGQFGFTLNMVANNDGIFVMVGAPGDDDLGAQSGSVYIYELNVGDWEQEAKLLASNGAAGDRFGHSMGRYTVTLMIGAPFHDGVGADSGAVYRFNRNSTTGVWTEQYQVTPEDAQAGDEFGASVDTFLDWYFIVGAPGDDDAAINAGAAYIFEFGSPPVQRRKTSITTEANARSASSVSIHDGKALIADPQNDIEAVNAGQVHLLDYNLNWANNGIMRANVTNMGSSFGEYLAVDGDLAAVTAHSGDFRSLYIFRRSAGVWTQEARITLPETGNADIGFSSLQLDGNTLLFNCNCTIPYGAVFIYVHDGTSWIEQARIVGSAITGAVNGGFLDGDTAVIGQYVYTRSAGIWSQGQQIAGVSALNGNRMIVRNGSNFEVWERNGGVFNYVATLNRPAPVSSSFGASVVLDGDTIMISEPEFSAAAMQVGAVYVYTFSGGVWSATPQRLTVTDAAPNARFGGRMALQGDRFVATSNEYQYRDVYFFERRGGAWTEIQGIRAPWSNIDFGKAIDFNGDELWIGAPLSEFGSTTNYGHVFSYEYVPGPELTLSMNDSPDPVVGGNILTYTYTVVNSGPGDAINAVLYQGFDSTIGNLIGSTGNCGIGGGEDIICMLGDIPAGNTLQFTVEIRLSSTIEGLLIVGAIITDDIEYEHNLDDNYAEAETVIFMPPPVPQLIAPANNTITTNQQPQFSWTPSADAVLYEFQIYVNSPQPDVWLIPAPTTTFTPPTPLLPLTYQWRVRAVDEDGDESQWSSVYTLTIEPTANAAPSLTAFNTHAPELTWNRVTWATGYEVQVDNMATFASPDANSGYLSAATFSYQPSYLPNGTWYFRVRARNADGTTWGAWSAPSSFSIIVP